VTAAILTAILLAVPAQPAGTAVVFERAAKALTSGDLNAAEKGFLEVLKREPDSIPALGNLGVTYSRMERYADAIRTFQRALRLAPGQPGLVLNLAIAYVKKSDYAAAKPLLAKLLENTQTRELRATCELFTGHPERALELLAGLPPSPETLFLTGTAQLRLKRRAEAQAAFQKLLTLAPPAQVHLLLGRAYADSTLFDEALVELRQAVALDPQSVPARLELAKTLISLRDNPAAEKELRAILASNPVQPDATYYLGAILVQQGRAGEAIPLLETSRAARPDAWGAYYYLGRAWMQKDPAKAVPLFERASRLGPGEAAVWFQLARAYQTLGEFGKAKAARQRHSAISEKALERESQIIPPNQ
jgi:tetratricopeptide (TPR) repeat protein